MKAPIHSVDNPRPFMPWDDRSCCLKCSPQWLPRWHMHGRRDSFLWTHCRTTFQAQGWNLPERAQIQEMRKYWTGPVQSFKQQLLIYDSLLLEHATDGSYLGHVWWIAFWWWWLWWCWWWWWWNLQLCWWCWTLLEQIPWLSAAWLPPPLSYSSKPRPN